VQPPAALGAVGQALLVNVGVANAVDLGAFQFTVDYDPLLLSLDAITPAQFLGSTGRSVSCSPINAVGHATLACTTLGDEPPPGVTGSGVLADVRFTPLVGGTGTLALSNVVLTTPRAVATVPATLDATVNIDGSTPTPCAGPCPTATPIPTNTPIPTPSGLPVVGLSPLDAVMHVGDTFTLSVDVANASDVAAFQFSLEITTNRLELQSADPGPFLGITGRSVFCPPVQVAQKSSLTVTYGCVTQGSGIPGATGNGTLATLTFRAVTPGAGTLTFQSATLADAFSANIPTSTTGTTFTVLAGPAATPTPCPGVCPTSTPTSTPSPTPTPVPFPATCPAAGSVCIQPDASALLVGDSVTVGVVANGVTDVGAYQVEVTFDPAVVSITGIANSTFLGSTGRTVLCAAPVIGTGTARFACSTLGPEPPAGPSGSGVLAVMTFQAVADGVSALSFSNTILTDPAAVPITVTLVGGSITVSSATPTPCAGPCPTATPTLTPTSTPTPAPISCPPIATTVVCVVPPSQVVAAGSQVSIDFVVDNVTNLAAYQVEIKYDPFLLTFVSASNDAFLGSTGRSVFCPPVILNLTSIVFSCATIGASPPGPDGTGMLFHATFQAGVNTGISALTLLQYDLTDPLANPIPAAAVNGSVEVQ
jgi:hypothetical protein